MNVQEVYELLDRHAPFSAQEDWDNSGLLVGDPEREVRRVLICLDLTREAAGLAEQLHADLVLTHHPVIFRAIRSVTPDEPWFRLLAQGTAVISAHTCLDAAEEGVSDALAEALGLEPLPTPAGLPPYLRLGECAEVTPEQFASELQESLWALGFDDCAPTLTEKDGAVSRVAVCGGAGGEFWREAKAAGADLYVTGEAKYHELVDAHNAGMPMLLLGHWLSEQFVLPRLADWLKEADPGLEIEVYLENFVM